MQTGRQYRRVNPPGLTLDNRGWCAPVRLTIQGGFGYGGGNIFLTTDMSDPAQVDLTLGRILWVGTASAGIHSFGYRLEQFTFNSEEGQFYRLSWADNFGGASIAEYNLAWFEDRWNAGIHSLYSIGRETGSASTGAFGRQFTDGCSCVRYHDEP